MPKDATKNIDRYKIKGGQLNEFDFHKNQEEFAEASKPEGNLIPGTPPEKREGALPLPSKPAKKAARRAASTKSTKTSTAKAAAKKSTKSTKASKPRATAKKSSKTAKAAKASKATKSTPRGATAKKLAARKAAKK